MLEITRTIFFATFSKNIFLCSESKVQYHESIYTISKLMKHKSCSLWQISNTTEFLFEKHTQIKGKTFFYLPSSNTNLLDDGLFYIYFIIIIIISSFNIHYTIYLLVYLSVYLFFIFFSFFFFFVFFVTVLCFLFLLYRSKNHYSYFFTNIFVLSFQDFFVKANVTSLPASSHSTPN